MKLLVIDGGVVNRQALVEEIKTAFPISRYRRFNKQHCQSQPC